ASREAELENAVLWRAEEVSRHLRLSLARVLRVPAARMGRAGEPSDQLQVLRSGYGERADPRQDHAHRGGFWIRQPSRRQAADLSHRLQIDRLLSAADT